VILDRGAALAVSAKGRSVLPVGVLGIRGDFRVGDAVRVLDPDGVEIGRGLARYAAVDAAVVAGKATTDVGTVHAEVVHRDELVVW
jgi:glutamate 5-kinase